MIRCINSKLKLPFTFLMAGLILSGCGASSGGNSTAKSTSPETNKQNSSLQQQSYIAESGLTPRQRFSKALKNLENGEDGQALAELNAYLVAVPRSTSARNLIEQISTDPSQYFPSENFSVNLTSGVSLSTLANRYLGSALKFYALAKYNNISNPSRVNIGQEIKIPLTQLARTQRAKYESLAHSELEKESEKSPIDLAMMEENEESSDSATNLAVNASKPVEVSEPVIAVIATADSTLNDLRKLAQNKDYAAAIEKITTLKTFGEFDKTSREIAVSTYIERAKEITETDSVLAASYYTQAAQLNLINKEPFTAFENFKMATILDEQNAQAKEEMLVLQKTISDKYHREASSAFRRQELDLAIEKWDMVLKVDPDHSSAKLYRVQALELKEKLDNINQN